MDMEPIAFYDESHQVGKDCENRFFSAFRERGWDETEWYRGIRRATGLEDSEGYDFFIDTDQGEIPIQVKSSDHFIEQYWKRHPESTALLVVVRLRYLYSRIRKTTIKKVEEHRAKDFAILRKPPWSVPTRSFD